ncbi:MAG: hypothetical protein EOL88_00525 [Bacteroidia bacterium]|nr:hypothetical protein [Bacteroidia bacterium]
MSEILKRKFNIGIGKETTRGTKVTPAFWLKPLNEDISEKIDVIATERSMGVIQDSEDQVISKKFASGVVAGEIFDQSFGFFLLGAFGSVSSSETGDSGVYEHTFSVLQSAEHPTFTIEKKRGDLEQVSYPNSVIESLKIDASVNDYVKFEAQLRGKKGESSSNSPSYVAENYFMAKNIAVKLAANYSGIDSATAIDARNISLTINKNIEDKDILNNDGPSDFLVKQVAVEGSVELYFSSLYMRDYALDGDSKAMRVELTNTDVTIGATSNPKLVIDLAKVKFSDPVESGDNNELVKMVVAFKGFYSLTDSKSAEAVLTNEKSSY